MNKDETGRTDRQPGTADEPDAVPMPMHLPGQDEEEHQGPDRPHGDARDAVEGPVGFASLRDPNKADPGEAKGS